MIYSMFPTRKDLRLVKEERNLEYDEEDRRIERNKEKLISF